jgi:integrase/recombinase XerD
MTPLRQRLLEELQRRNYSSETTRGYILAVKQFAEHFGKSPDRLGPEEVRRYQLYLLKQKKLSAGTVKIRMSALRFFYRKALKRRHLIFDDLPLPQTPKKLPDRCQGPMRLVERLTAVQIMFPQAREVHLLDSS